MALDSILSTPVSPPPQKGGTSPSAGPSGGNGGDGSSSTTSTSSTSSSGSANAANNSSGSSSSGGPASGSAKGASKGTSTSRSAKPNSQAQSAASSSTKARPSNASNPTQAAAAAGARNATTQNKNVGPSFIEALAQTQADSQVSADATAAAATATAAPQPVTGSKSKGTKNDDPDTTGASLGFLSQSLAAAMAGLQSTSPGQNLQANTTTDDDSTDAVSLAGGNGGSTIQSVVASIAQSTAEELKAATTAADGKADPTPSSAAPVTDNTATAAANAFQAHMVSRAQSAANTEALSNKVNAPVGTAGFPDEVGDKITWMANQGVQSASLQLTPEHLGPVEVRISMQDGSASVTFNAAHADTRAALEQTLPRLREMFSSQGLTLTDASVSQQSPRGQPQRQAVSAIGATRGVSDADSTSSVASVTRIQLGLVDTYA